MSAGLGTRVREFTGDKPKCLLPVGGRTMLQRWFDKCEEWRVSDVLVNMHYKMDKVMDYLRDMNWNEFRITLTYEKELLGTAQTLFKNRKFVKGEHFFGVIYTDVWTSFDLRKMINFHKRRPGLVTLGLYEAKDIKDKGVAVVKEGMVVDFEEKPKNPKSRCIWGGVLIAHPSLFSVIDSDVKDIANDLLPKLAKMGKMNAFFIREPVFDIGESPEEYKRVCEEVSKLGFGVL